MSPSAAFLAAAAAAAATTLGLLVALGRWAKRLGLLDYANARSSHLAPRPRAAGMAILGGVLAGTAFLTAVGESPSLHALIVLGAALLVAILGLLDDMFGLSARSRLAVQLVSAVVVVVSLGGFSRLPLPPPADLELPTAAGLLLATLWLVAVTNFFNFMDGIDGLAGGQAVLTLLVLAATGLGPRNTPVVGLLLVALIVFLRFNWAPARLFLGDAGSGFLGFLLAAAPWLGSTETREARVLLVASSLGIFLLDPVWTLAVRLRRGARLTESHRDHLYQRLVDPARDHGRATVALLALAALPSALAVWAFGDAGRSWIALGAALAVFAGELALARRAAARFEVGD